MSEFTQQLDLPFFSPATDPTSLGNLLQAYFALTPLQLAAALGKQGSAPLGAVVVALGFVAPRCVAMALQRQAAIRAGKARAIDVGLLVDWATGLLLRGR